MVFDEHARATLIAYYAAHRCWKEVPPQHKTDKVTAKALMDSAHSKLIGVAELMATRSQQEKER
jgi:hypothetical protein